MLCVQPRLSSSMETLSEMFELEIATVHSIISKMIINEELMVSFPSVALDATRSGAASVRALNLLRPQASLDQPTQTVVMHRTEPTSLQNMALQLAEKLGSLVENNERVFDLKQGVYGGYFNRGALRRRPRMPPAGFAVRLASDCVPAER